MRKSLGTLLPGAEVPDISGNADSGQASFLRQPLAQLLPPGIELFLELLEVVVPFQGGLPEDDAAVSLHFGEKQVPGDEALNHRGPAVKLLHGPVGFHLQFIRGELPGLEHGVVAVVLAPVPADNPVLGLHLPVERRAGQRGEHQILQGIQVQLAGNLHGVPDYLVVVLFGAEDEHAVDLDAEAVEIVHAVLDALHGLGLVVGLQSGGIDGFQPHEDDVAAALSHEIQEFRVLGGFHPHLGAPFDLQTFGDDALAQFLGALAVGGKIVVAEKDMAGLEAVLANLGDDPVDGSDAVLAPEHHDNRTEAAVEGAAPGGGDGDDAPPISGLPAVNQVVIGDGQGIQVPQERAPGVLLDGVPVPIAEIVDVRQAPAVGSGR